MTGILQPLAVLTLAAVIHAQPPTPATQPVRPPDRPPAGEPQPLPTPEPDLGGARERGMRDRPRSTPEAGDPELGRLTLTGCLERAGSRAWRLRPIEGDEATVTEEVRLGGDVESLRAHVGQRVELRGTYEQATPASRPATFAVDRLTVVGGACRSPR
ncbi:hypothetical protein TBR22_A43780 [Luteitalea sp. TBR-22]|uniref:hypothetical protein n=1 Tax=Luteitalea sp. TBR-22 TaxID=2802971 RepID=UPI001AF18D10|nr:hypothetical protein [Luteitalea sp. TBR-22]BCS35151.1 hypothetical protein TBR22_A43780 [Luteitalea sp. TBR-22]